MYDHLALSPQFQFWLKRACASIGTNALIYLTVATLFTAAWLWWRAKPARRAPLQQRPITMKHIGREMLASVGPVVVFGSFVPVLFLFGLGKHTQFYRHIDERGWPYFFFSIVLLLLIQDTWFYWTHRLMHHRRLFRWFHLKHHRSTNPNPWSTYSMSVLEALVLSGVNIIILFVTPTTGAALLIVGWLNIIYGVYGHLGYELYPSSIGTHWLGRWINTATAHNAHHAKGRYNYGYYFLIWDRLMGTAAPMSEAARVPANHGNGLPR
jgi:sterol desaturase/sphingolipid hydroxylase (fatty acid hydroxylase superfamily)